MDGSWAAGRAARHETVPLQLTPAEVDELWHFLHGDIMEGGIRAHLRRAMGLCGRHSWAYAQVEVELWQHGAGVRHGHQPFDVCVLYEDLLGEAVRRLTARRLWHPRSPTAALAAGAPCWICVGLGRGDRVPGEGATEVAGRLRRSYAGASIAQLTEEANAGTHLTAWLEETRTSWEPSVCPSCRAGGEPGQPDPSSSTVENLCRTHLMASAELTPDERTAVASSLTGLRQSVQRLLGSMADGAAAASAVDDASWVRALAWFTGWHWVT